MEGMERTEIPQVVIHKLLLEFRKWNINPVMQPDKVNYRKVRGFLKDLGYSHLFKSIMKIISILTNRRPNLFSDEQRETLINRFNRVQESFEKHKGIRTNFFFYSYVMYKLCEMLGYDEFLESLPLLKAPQHQIAADRIWKKICKDCGYTFIPTDPSKGAFYSHWDN